MTETFVVALGQETMLTALMLAAPMLGVSLLVGLGISIFQAVTQINEMTLTFVPKFIGMAVVVVLFGPWMLQQVVHFTVRLFEMLPYMVQ
jgi:flagellar biosynthetic protein FliQ